MHACTSLYLSVVIRSKGLRVDDVDFIGEDTVIVGGESFSGWILNVGAEGEGDWR